MVQVYTEHDRELARAVVFRFADGDTVEFQFPPKINSDNRKGSWKEGELRGTEPVANFKTSGPREITLTWTYIVDGRQWTTQKISEQVKLVRGYFARVRERDRARNLVVKFQMWCLGGKDEMSARIKNIDVKHGDTIICPNGDVECAYPLRTDITVDLRLWTKGGIGDEKTQNISGTKDKLTPDWF